MDAKYDKIGNNYNQTRKADPYLTSRLLYHLAPKTEGLYLDIGCGTGNYTHEFQQSGFSFIGIDPSLKMLEKAKAKNREIDWRLGTAEKTELPDNSIDGIVASLTIHHWNNLEKAFAELSRVLKIHSKIVLFTATPKQMNGYWLNHYFPQMLKDSMLQMPALEVVEKAMQKAGISLMDAVPYFIQPDLKDQFLYCGKQNPELYFDAHIRQGISSFSALANQKEVTSGLHALRADIDKGKITQIMQSYENELGDYLFVIGEVNGEI